MLGSKITGGKQVRSHDSRLTSETILEASHSIIG